MSNKIKIQEHSPTAITSKITSTVGDPMLLRERYHAWKKKNNLDDITSEIVFSLVPANTHASIGPKGRIHVNVGKGSISAKLIDVDPKVPLALWVTRDAKLYSTEQPNDNLAYIGAFHFQQGNTATLKIDITTLMKTEFQIGQAIVAPADTPHLQSMVLAGSPTLYQRLMVSEYQQQISTRENPSILKLLAPVANANEPTGFPGVFNDLVTQGEDLFFNEDFSGNGRSCGTCHPATNNFTIDTDFIASLPNNDPLFVAENVPSLIFGNPANLDAFGNPRRFENPALMRAFGLIVENIDGFGDLENRFTMRSVPHNIGMTVSVQTPPLDLTPPDERTGWSGDGAPSGIVGGIPASGRVRDFILGAIVQHYPKTMDRSFTGPNPDFRVPTPTELDALEAFMFSVGRQEELELAAGAPNELILKDPDAEAGKVLFRDGVPGGNRTCNACHGNGGANFLAGANPGNRNFNTGVELFLQNRITDPDFTVVGEPRPVDGGFGLNPNGDFSVLVEQPGFVNENFGDQTFNSVSVVESADTPPFFHNNIIDNLEDATAFYQSSEFLIENGGVIPFSSTEITQVANFMRVINAIDNIENSALRQSSRMLIALTQTPVPEDVVERIGSIMIADTEDAIEVLEEGGLHNTGGNPTNAVKQLESAVKRVEQALNTNAPVVDRNNHITRAQSHLNDAISIMKF